MGNSVEVITKCNIEFFADDTMIYFVAKNLDEMQQVGTKF